MNTFKLDINSNRVELNHYWELCVGSCHAATALRADYQTQLTRCQRELGFKYVRFHGLFDDDMSVAFRPMFSPQIKLSFSNIDKLFDFLLSINMKPFIEIGFMPEVLASGDKTVFHYKGNTTPPKSYDEWAWFIGEFVKHIIDRYGRSEVREWFFEIWNEPNLGGPDSPFGFWSSTKEEYFKLYKVTVEAVKSVDSFLRVGGPATSNNAWITDFLNFCKASGAPVDFVTTHHYPTDIVLGYGVEDSANFTNPLDFGSPEKLSEIIRTAKEDPEAFAKIMSEYNVFKGTLWEHVDRGVLTDMAKQARKETGALPLYYTEWGSLAGLPSDGPFGASFIPKTILDNHGLVDGYSFWTFSDIFEESGQESPEFFGGFGLMTQHGVPKAPYRAFELLHKLGTELYESRYQNGTLDVYAVKKQSANAVQLMAVNHHSLLHDIKPEKLCVNLSGCKKCIAADVLLIDADNANALAQYEKMGSPQYISQGRIAALEAASELVRKPIAFTQNGSEVSIDTELMPMATALITVYFE